MTAARGNTMPPPPPPVVSHPHARFGGGGSSPATGSFFDAPDAYAGVVAGSGARAADYAKHVRG